MYGIILFERVKVMIAIALIYLCLVGEFPSELYKIQVLLFFFFFGGGGTTALSSKTIQLNLITIWKDFPNLFLNVLFP